MATGEKQNSIQNSICEPGIIGFEDKVFMSCAYIHVNSSTITNWQESEVYCNLDRHPYSAMLLASVSQEILTWATTCEKFEETVLTEINQPERTTADWFHLYEATGKISLWKQKIDC